MFKPYLWASIISIFFCELLYADPWFTGPILAPAGKTIPAGHTNFEIYAFDITDKGSFDRHSLVTPTPTTKSYQYSAIFSHGLTDKIDMQFVFPYIVNKQDSKQAQGVGDVQLLLGYQLLTQKPNSWIPNLRATIQESIPTGKFEQLSPDLLGTDALGRGSYRTIFSLNFQYLNEPISGYPLRTRLCLGYIDPSSVTLNGINHYGGAEDTFGTINPGYNINADLAFELSVTQNWVLVMEGFWYTSPATSFSGNPGTTSTGLPASIGRPGNSELSLAPAVEYNFNANYGIIAGVWYSQVGSKKAPDFSAPVIAFNAYW